MSVTESDLRKKYEAMPEEDLLALVAQSAKGGLTSLAESVLKEVLNSRGVSTEVRTQIAASAVVEAEKDDKLAGSLASPGSRLVARVIDIFFLSLVSAIFLQLNRSMIDVVILAFAAYLLLADGLPGGWSIGKRLLGLAVVDAETGMQCSWLQSVFRNLLHLGFLFDWIFITGTKRRQRLGDLVARTIVVRVSS